MIIEINVTQYDIRKARKDISINKLSSKHCPIARALRKSIGKNKNISACCGIFYIDNFIYKYPKIIIDFISAFDNKEVVKPFKEKFVFEEIK